MQVVFSYFSLLLVTEYTYVLTLTFYIKHSKLILPFRIKCLALSVGELGLLVDCFLPCFSFLSLKIDF